MELDGGGALVVDWLPEGGVVAAEVERPPGPGPGDEVNLHQDFYTEQEGEDYHGYLADYPRYSRPLLSTAGVGSGPPIFGPSDPSSSFTQTFLRGILTSIDSRDPVVANAWLETLLDAIDLLPVEVVRQEIVAIAVNKSQLSQPPFSRIAACKILGKLATKLEPVWVRSEVLPATLALCQDAEVEVRTTICHHLPLVARGVGLELTQSAVLPAIVELSRDEEGVVRLAAVETVVHLLSLLEDDVCSGTIVPLVMRLCEQARASEDCSLPAVARHLGRLCHGLTPNLSEEQKRWFVVYYQELASLGTGGAAGQQAGGPIMPDLVPRTPAEDRWSSERYVEVRLACAYNLPAMVLFVGPAHFTDQLFATFCQLATDPSPGVRRTLASSLHELIKIIGGKFSLTKMQVVALFQDSQVEVLAAMVANMVYIIDALARFGVLQFGSGSSYSQELSSAILNMEEVISTTRNWRLHADCLEKLSCLANCISASLIQTRYIPLLFTRAQKSRPLPCRVAAVRTLLVILRFTVKEEDRTNIIQRTMTELAEGRSFHYRMLFLKMCEMAVMLFSRSYFKTNFFTKFLSLSQDRVPNIRLKVVGMLPQLKSLLRLPADRQLLLHLEAVVKELLLQETDRDVLNALQTAIHSLADIETSDDSLTVMALSEEDRDDERKLREEKLIANMEEQIKQVQGVRFEQLIAPSAIPSRLRTLGGSLDRKRSESLPPALDRSAGDDTAPSAAAVRVRYSSPEPQRPSSASLRDFSSLRSDSQQSFAAELGRSRTSASPIWSSSEVEIEKNFKGKGSSSSLPYSASLENLDPSTQEFLVDAGIKLPSTMTSAASLPNLSAIGLTAMAREPIVRSMSIPESSSSSMVVEEESELSKYLISNKEMEQYEADYLKAAAVVAGGSMDSVDGRQRGRSNTRLRPPSFTSALIEKKPGSSCSPPISLAPTSASVEAGLDDKKAITPPPPVVIPFSDSPSPPPSEDTTPASGKPLPQTASRVSPQLRSEDRATPKWNDGSIERLAEKWAAKRDSLLKETGGVLAENLQQRKLAMEQKLESVKKSIPKGSFGLSSPQLPQQKRLSLCDPMIAKQEKLKRISLEVDMTVPPPDPAIDSDEEDPLAGRPLVNKLATAGSSSTTGSKTKGSSPLAGRKASPELGSSDSDDSLPPYPSVDQNRVYHDQPLPPPPQTVDLPLPSPPRQLRKGGSQSSFIRQANSSHLSFALHAGTSKRLIQPPPPSSLDQLALHDPTKNNQSGQSLALQPTGRALTSTGTGPVMSQFSIQRPSFSSFRMVTAPQTLVAVSRSVQVPQRSIADSPSLPAPQPNSRLQTNDPVQAAASSGLKPVSSLLMPDSATGLAPISSVSSHHPPGCSSRESLSSSLSASTLSSPALRGAQRAARYYVGSAISSGQAGGEDSVGSKTVPSLKTRLDSKTPVISSPQLQLKSQFTVAHSHAFGLSSTAKSKARPVQRETSGLEETSIMPALNKLKNKTVQNLEDSASVSVEQSPIHQGDSSADKPSSRLQYPARKPTNPPYGSSIAGNSASSKNATPPMSSLLRPGGTGPGGRPAESTEIDFERGAGRQQQAKAPANKTVIYIRKDEASDRASNESKVENGLTGGQEQPSPALPAKNKNNTGQARSNLKTALQKPVAVQSVYNGKTVTIQSFLDQNQNESLLQQPKGQAASSAFFLHEQRDIKQKWHKAKGRSPSPVSGQQAAVVCETACEPRLGNCESSAAPSPSASFLLHPESSSLSWPDKSMLLVGSARKSSGLRMWQGGQQARRGPPSRQQSASTGTGSSRSPSPSAGGREDTGSGSSPAVNRRPGTSIKVVSHATLPRASTGGTSRLRGALSSTEPPSAISSQRRSYGGGISSLMPPSGGSRQHASAPSTPRQSSMDLRSTSPSNVPAVAAAAASDSRRRSAHYPLQGAGEAIGPYEDVAAVVPPTRAVSERSLNHMSHGVGMLASGSSGVRYFGGSHQSLMPSAASSGSMGSMASVSRIGLGRHRGTSGNSSIALRPAAPTTPSTGQKQLQQPQPKAQSLPQPQPLAQISRSRVDPPHRGGFGFNQK